MKWGITILFLRSPLESNGGQENMFYGASSAIFKRAEELRFKMTEAENILWKAIHINEWKLKFRRQHPIYKYVADFYCHAVKLVIELDGGIHEAEEVKRYDADRENTMKDLGLSVLRFKNEQVIKNTHQVMQIISETISNLKNIQKTNSEKSTQALASASSGDRGEGNCKKQLYIIKIGGNIVDDEKALLSFLSSFANVKSKKILVHGGGKIATKIGNSLGIESKYMDGRRITDADTIDLVTMVYGGLINKKIVTRLQSLACNAIGITGADANLIPATRRPVAEIDFGWVGDVNSSQIKMEYWQLLLDNALTPVVAPLTHDGKGNILNTNADTMAQEVAKALSPFYEVHLIYSFEKEGVLLDVNNENSLVPSINQATYKKLKEENKIFAGMIPKLDNAFEALKSGVKKVIIGKAENLEQLINGHSGTSIINE